MKFLFLYLKCDSCNKSFQHKLEESARFTQVVYCPYCCKSEVVQGNIENPAGSAREYHKRKTGD